MRFLFVAGFPFFLLPIYAWKREQIFNENLGYKEQTRSIKETFTIGKIIIYLLCLLWVFGNVAVGLSNVNPTNVEGDAVSQLRNIQKEQSGIYGLTLTSDDIKLQGQKAALLISQGKITEGLESIDKTLQKIPDNQDAIPLYYLKSATLLGLMKNEEALKYSEKIIEIDPNNPLGYSTKGRVLIALRKIEDAIIEFDKAIQLNPNFADAWGGKGLALEYQGKYEEALEADYKAYQLNPNMPGTVLSIALLLNEMGRTEEAAVFYKKAKELDPQMVSKLENQY